MIRNLFLTLLGVEAILIAALLTVLSCNPQKAEGPDGNTEPLITMEKTECFGTCPVYTIQIYEDGKADYLGKKHVKNIGHFQQQLPSETIAALIRSFQDASFFSLQDEYVAEVTDLPVTYLSFRYQNQYKKIKDLINAPAQLDQLEQQIADIADAPGWQLVAD